MKVSYLDLNGKYSTGELIVHTDVSSEVVEIFRDIFNCEFRIEKMIPIFNYECSDDKSMGDNNTSHLTIEQLAEVENYLIILLERQLILTLFLILM